MKRLTRLNLPSLDLVASQYQRWLFPVWSLVALLASLAKLNPVRHNNFTIFASSWGHLRDGLPLYTTYPEQYHDLYLYGPTFALLIAPLSLLPEPLAYLGWQMMLSSLLFFAISRLPISPKKRLIVGLFTIHELITALMMQQWNVGIGALVILCYAFVEREQEHWAALCLAIGLTTKIYGIVGLAFFPISRHKGRFILWSILWTALLLALPFVAGKASYIWGEYTSWFSTLATKNNGNQFALMQNISLLGMIRKISGVDTYSDLLPIGIGLALYGLPFLRFSQYKARSFTLMLLSVTLLFTVLFSTGSESSSYVIAFPGVILWYLARPSQRRTRWDVALLVGTFVLSSLSPTDIFPKYVREQWVIPYALKALFPTLVWLKASYELLVVDFRQEVKPLNE
ncbi:MAG: glycosyltransferase family 87 protein [Porphyromonadaceae bacterium]|nr:glycosyltransferase family 87 protein [Porphyromonadaceae bacterium]